MGIDTHLFPSQVEALDYINTLDKKATKFAAHVLRECEKEGFQLWDIPIVLKKIERVFDRKRGEIERATPFSTGEE